MEIRQIQNRKVFCVLKTDVVVIGAGAVGCAVARELSKYKVDVIVVDKNEDVGGDASKSNSAIIHTGYDASPDTLESRLVVAANPMYDEIARDLDVPFARIGAILPAITDEQFAKLPEIKEKTVSQSLTVRASGPICSREEAKATRP